MNQILEAGQTIRMEPSGMPLTVGPFLGGGGQGEVYQAEIAGKAMALKWYFPVTATTEQRNVLKMLIEKGPPDEQFLWPLELVSAADLEGFGYIMPLRELRYKGIVDLMKRRIEPTFRALTTAGLALAHSFLQLHAKGLCYRDISFGNVFFDPKSGDILICDNDNVTVDGQDVGGIIGTPRFMAPEIVRGEAAPSTQTDLFSLSVLLFYMFMVHHPLEGKKELSIHCLDLPAMRRLYGTEPVFVFDPADDSNRPVKGHHDNALAFWTIYPQYLRDLFTEAFTDGIRDPIGGRIRESQWRAAMVRLRDSIVYCSGCGAENFYDVDLLRAPGSGPRICWSCNRAIQLPPRIRVGENILVLNHDAQIFPHHVDEQPTYDFSEPVAAVVQHPSNPNIWGLKNLSEQKWVITTADNTVKDVEPGRSLTLAAGIKVNFGKTEGEIRV